MDHLLRGGSQTNDELFEDAVALGVILPEQLKEAKEYVLWVDHWPAVELFMRCMTQWRATSNGVIGLDYAVVLEMAKLYQVPRLPVVMEDIQVLEARARDLLNKEAKR